MTAPDNPTAIATPAARLLPRLDTAIESLLEALHEGRYQPPRAAGPVPEPAPAYADPAPREAGAVHLYCHAHGDPRAALRVLAAESGAAIVACPIDCAWPAGDVAARLAGAIGIALAAITGQNVTLIAEGAAAAVALACLTMPGGVRRHVASLAVLTPVLGAPDGDDGAGALVPADVASAALPAIPFERLRSLAPILVVTAAPDPYRRGAERFVERLRIADAEVSALCFPGTLHGFALHERLIDAAPAVLLRQVLGGWIHACPDRR